MDYVDEDIQAEAAERNSVFGMAESVFNSILPMLKKQDQDIKKIAIEEYLCLGNHRKDPIDNLEQFHPLYKDSIRQMYKIRPHADPDYFPRNLFENLSPHRKADEADWIKNNYECITLPVWMDFQDTIKRGVNVNNYKIAWPEEWPAEYDQDSPRVYLEDGIKLFQSIHTWFSNQLFDVKLRDANGVIAVQPYKMSPVVNESGEAVMADEMVEPIPMYYSCDKVLACEEDEYYLLLSEEKSVVDWSGQSKKMGYVLYWFDSRNIIRIEQTGKYTDWAFISYVYIEHGWDAVPVWKLKGQPKMKGKHLYFQSPFLFAVGNLNLALKNQINKQMAEANSAWPHKIMVADKCDYESDGWVCEDGRLAKDGMVEGVCPKCRGRGIKDKPSPGSTMMVDEEELRREGNNIGLDRIRFISPESGILEHLERTIAKNMTEGRSILHLYTTDGTATGQDQTATGEIMDRNSMYAFMRPILDEGFDILEGVINAILQMRYGGSIEEVKVIRPTDLDYKTSADYLAEYTALLEKGAPPIVLYKVLEKYIHSMFYASGDDRKIWKIILAVDTVAAKKDDEIRNMIGSGTLPKWKALLHTGIFSYINELMNENENFLELDIEEQKTMLIEKAKAEADEIKSASTTNTDPLNGLFQDRTNPSGQTQPPGQNPPGANRQGVPAPTPVT